VGERTVKEKDSHLPPGGEAQPIGPEGIYLGAFDLTPVPIASPHPQGLLGGEDGEADPRGGQDIEGLKVHRTFGKPHPFGASAEAILEIPYPPVDEDFFVLT